MTSLARIIAEDVRAFAYCDETEMDDDFAVKQLERIGFWLQRAPEAEIQAFRDAVKTLQAESRAQGDKKLAEQYKTMVKHLGLPTK